jgi:NADPH:quinone reductase-like Zn-dependent oxidoreductase
MSRLPKLQMKERYANKLDLLFIRDLLEDGKIRPVIDECYPLNKTTEAFRYFEKGHTRGKVVITIAAQE